MRHKSDSTSAYTSLSRPVNGTSQIAQDRWAGSAAYLPIARSPGFDPASRSTRADVPSPAIANTVEKRFDFQIAPDSRLLSMAADAEHILSAGHPFVSRAGVLLPTHPAQQIEWFEKLQLVLIERKPQLLQVSHSDTIRHVLLAPNAGENTVLVTMEAEYLCDPGLFDVYATHYCLTPSEKSVLWELTGGLEPKRIALKKGVAVSTVRTQIKALLLKTSEPSMRHLLIRLARLSQLAPTQKPA